MKIASFNVNSIRRRLPIVLSWLEKNTPDVLCLQETKVRDEEFPLEAFSESGYHVTFRGMKGYNGVATLSRSRPERVIYGLEEGPDGEDFRILQTVIEGVPIINTYVPQGYVIHTVQYAHKLQWFKRLRRYFEQHLTPDQPALWLGDLNVAPQPIDVYEPQKHLNEVCFHVEARQAYQEAVGWGWVDVFRQHHPARVQYTYWDYFRNHFPRNRGWRIDHILATAPLAACCTQTDVDSEPRKAEGASDHTIVWATFDTQNLFR